MEDEYKCEECGAAIYKGGEIIGCLHTEGDDIIELSGKHISDGMEQSKADWKAIGQLKEEI